MDFLHTSTEVRLPASSNRHHNIDLRYKGFFEVVLASEEGLARRASSSRLQNSSWTWAHCKAASLHLCILRLQSQKITGFTFRLRFCGTRSCLLTVLLPLGKPIYRSPLSPPSLFYSYQKRSYSQREMIQDIKNRREGKWKMKTRGFWERSCRQTKENIILKYSFNWDAGSPVNFVSGFVI